jgi:hypothetical protein
MIAVPAREFVANNSLQFWPTCFELSAGGMGIYDQCRGVDCGESTPASACESVLWHWQSGMAIGNGKVPNVKTCVDL